MHIGYPFRIDGDGRTAAESEQEHIRHLIQQVLFTSPGERVNRPDFGSGLMQLVFGAPNDEMLAATQFLIQGSLQQWLGDLIQVEAVEVQSQEGTLNISVQYIARRSQQRQVARFER
jgi:phage baseplate assembly protein W